MNYICITYAAVPIITGPEDVTVTEGKDTDAVLPFNIVSFPPHQSVSYEHNGNHLDLSKGGFITFDNGSILIRSPGKGDAGKYRIIVINAYGQTSAVIRLHVYCNKHLINCKHCSWLARCFKMLLLLLQISQNLQHLTAHLYPRQPELLLYLVGKI